MRIFKYWIEHTKDLKVDNVKQTSTVFGGSNVSQDEAKRDAESKLQRAQRIINGEINTFEDKDYEVDILEEVIDQLDENNVVTRNRYGALVLNSDKLMFIDIDDYSKTFLDWLLNRKMTKKAFILKKIMKSIQKEKYADYGFRVYETFKGFRVIVQNNDFSPRSDLSKKLMEEFNADFLYSMLCIQQNCYRARLTPKPYRMKQKGIRVVYPNRNEAEEARHGQWVEAYEQKSENYSTCKLLLKHGKVNSNKVVDYHDRLTRATERKKLA